MTRKNLDYELQTIREDLLILSSMVENALRESASILLEYNLEKCQKIITNDALINQKRYELEAEIVATIAKQSPVTRDLRLLSSTMTICSELERIGDYAKSVAKSKLRLQEVDIPRINGIACNMGLTAMDMLHRAMTAFVIGDIQTAKRIIPEDDKCDGMYEQVYSELMKLVSKDLRNVNYVNIFLSIAHSLERAGDRVTNICERTIYVETGELDLNLASIDGL